MPLEFLTKFFVRFTNSLYGHYQYFIVHASVLLHPTSIFFYGKFNVGKFAEKKIFKFLLKYFCFWKFIVFRLSLRTLTIYNLRSQKFLPEFCFCSSEQMLKRAYLWACVRVSQDLCRCIKLTFSNVSSSFCFHSLELMLKSC